MRAILEKHGKTEVTVSALAKNFLESGSEIINQSVQRSKPECQAGCSYCCHAPVSITALEALWVARHMRESRTPEELEIIQTRVTEHARKVETLSWEQHMDAKIPCALLDPHGHCSVYSARPMSCRRVNSLSKTKCQDAFNKSLSGGSVELDMVALAWGQAVSQGLVTGLKEASIDAKNYELHSALSRALGATDVERKWLQGELAFDGCKCDPASAS